MQKNNLELICSISELVSLFEKKTNIQGFLQEVVQLVAEHMRTDACSIFLRDVETEDLILSATTGLSAKAIGKVKLAPGEGVTGQALKKLTPINVPDGPKDPHFKFIPGIMEERYTATLAVPIVHGLNRIGVILLQHSLAGYFDDKDTRALKTIASQLATLLENAKLLMELRKNKKNKYVQQTFKRPYSMPCSTESRGISIGTAVVIDREQKEQPFFDQDQYGHSLEDFLKALEKTEHQLEELQKGLEEKLSDIGSLIFGSHLLMLKDEAFSGSMIKLIHQGIFPVMAIKRVVSEYSKLLTESQNPIIQEKVQDLKDLGHRLIRNLSLLGESEGDYTGQIVVSEELLPSELAKLSAQHAEGFLIYGSGATTHISILARSLEIPLVHTKDAAFFSIQDGETLVIDGYQAATIIQPASNSIRKYYDLVSIHKSEKEKPDKVNRETRTKDGKNIMLQANINLLSDLAIAKTNLAQGIGLYRSEFPFIIRNTFPSEEEQYHIYSHIVREMPKEEVVFRTLDIGGDKVFSHLPGFQEANPFLGLRAIRFSLKNREIFKDQIKAMLRAGALGKIKIMLPLVSSLEEFLEAQEIFSHCILELEEEKATFCCEPELGVMIEIPSAVLQAEELARQADFLSIGTNDLTQYLLGVDRTNQDVSNLYNPLHPAVLRSIRIVKKAGEKFNKPVSICGEAAAEREMLIFLIGIDINIISVDPRLIPKVQKEISGIDSQRAAGFAEELLLLNTTKEIKEHLKGF